MSTYIGVSAKELVDRRTDHSSVVEFKVFQKNGGYFGKCYGRDYLLVYSKNNPKAGIDKHHYWGFPDKSIWDTHPNWGQPRYELSHNLDATADAGTLPGRLATILTIQKEVPIDRGTSRQGSTTVTVGIDAGATPDYGFENTSVNITLHTTEIKLLESLDLIIRSFIGGPNTPKYPDPNILYANFEIRTNNSEGYYRFNIYKDNDKEPIAKNVNSGVSPKNYEISLEGLYGDIEFVFKVDAIGKDGVIYKTNTKTLKVHLPYASIYSKLPQGIEPIDAIHFKNVGTKKVYEVYTKIGNEIHKIEE